METRDVFFGLLARKWSNPLFLSDEARCLGNEIKRPLLFVCVPVYLLQNIGLEALGECMLIYHPSEISRYENEQFCANSFLKHFNSCKCS